MINWACGITTVLERGKTLLPRTLSSLEEAGFAPLIFVDSSRLGVYGNWVLTAWELYLRNPYADSFIIFQDDVATYKNLRRYLEYLKYPLQGYFNLMTWPENEELAQGKTGWFESNQKGRSACGLMFTNQGLRLLLQQNKFVEKARDTHKPTKCLDGTIIDAMRSLNWKEYCHFPSLLKHTGDNLSSINNRNSPATTSFRGEDFDALNLLKELNEDLVCSKPQ